MPLSDPAPRELLHQRDIRLSGYRRADGLFDIDAEIADAKTYELTLESRTAARESRVGTGELPLSGTRVGSGT